MIILRVFTNEEGKFGNPVGIMIDETRDLDSHKRQEIASKSGFSEIVFINSTTKSDVSIFSPQREIPFAGHALVGAAYFLNHECKKPMKQLVSQDKIIKTWETDGITWVMGELSILPNWNFEQLASSAAVETLSPEETAAKKHTVVWAWVDEDKGVIRARTFASDWGIAEDEANGSGSMRLVATLNRDLIVHHGKGSLIYAKPSNSDYAEVGGLVQTLQVRE